MTITIINFREIRIEWWTVLEGKRFLFQIFLTRNGTNKIVCRDNWKGEFGPFDTMDQAMLDVKNLRLIHEESL